MIDLHCHSTASDGELSPSRLVQRVKEAGLEGFALTDHDTAGGVDEAARAARLYGVEFVPGVELTGYHAGREWHIQAIGIDAPASEVRERLRPFVLKRADRMREMLSLLRSAGIRVEFEEVEREAAGGVVGRMHLASVLVKKGFVKRRQDAYRRFIGDRAPFYVPKLAFTVRQAVELAYDLGGVPVLAHPGIPGLDEHIPEFAEWGLAGLEAFTPKHTPAAERRYERMAADLGLVPTGGTDFHAKPGEAGPGVRGMSPDALCELLERRRGGGRTAAGCSGEGKENV